MKRFINYMIFNLLFIGTMYVGNTSELHGFVNILLIIWEIFVFMIYILIIIFIAKYASENTLIKFKNLNFQWYHPFEIIWILTAIKFEYETIAILMVIEFALMLIAMLKIEKTILNARLKSHEILQKLQEKS